MSDVINVVDHYGADPVGAADSTEEFQAAIDEAKVTGKMIVIPPGQFFLGYLDLTGVPDFPGGVTIVGSGFGRTLLYASEMSGPNRPLFDCANSNRLRFDGFTVLGMNADGSPPASMPLAAFLFGTKAGSTNRCVIRDVEAFGYFDKACVTIIGGSNSLLDFCSFQQWNANGRALYMSAWNPWQLGSPELGVFDQGTQVNEWTFRSCEFHAWNGIAHEPGNNETVRLEGHSGCINSLTFDACLFDNSHANAIWSNGNLGKVLISGGKVYSETGNPPQRVWENGGGSVKRLNVIGLDFEAVTAGTVNNAFLNIWPNLWVA